MSVKPDAHKPSAVQGREAQEVQGAPGVQGVGAQDVSAYDGTPPEDVFAEDGRMLKKNTQDKGESKTSGRHFEALLALMLLGSFGLY